MVYLILHFLNQMSVVIVGQLLSRVQLFAALWTSTPGSARQASQSFTISQSLLKHLYAFVIIEAIVPLNFLRQQFL